MVEYECECGEELIHKFLTAGYNKIVQDEWVCPKDGNIYRVSDKTGNLYLVKRGDKRR
jgi:hypothetical protein